jgi:hypothetical protein
LFTNEISFKIIYKEINFFQILKKIFPEILECFIQKNIKR